MSELLVELGSARRLSVTLSASEFCPLNETREISISESGSTELDMVVVGSAVLELQMAAIGPPGTNGAGFVIEKFILTAVDISNKQVILGQVPPKPLEVALLPYGGDEQDSGVDFVVTGNILSWDSLALETLLTVGDKIRVTYLTSS